MQIIKFDYYSDVYTQKGDRIVSYIVDRPKIPIRLNYNHHQSKTPVLCLLDSGADNNLFPAHMGEAVGIDILKFPKYTTKGIGNSPPIDTYRVNNVKLIIGYEIKPDRIITVNIDFSFCHNVPLLGREGFFKFFNNISFIKNSSVELHF